MSAAQVVAITATQNRPSELARLLTSLSHSTVQLVGWVVVDNAPEQPVGGQLAQAPLRVVYRAAERNLGPAGGLKLGAELALAEFPAATHLWYLDDDAVVEPGTLGTLLAAMEEPASSLAHPLVVDAEGRLGWFPGLCDRTLLRVAAARPSAAEFMARAGSAPLPFTWSTGVALLVTREAVERCGPHRAEFFVRGEDLDFSLRLTAQSRGVLVPGAVVQHLPPVSTAGPEAEYPKHVAMLQNLAYLAVRQSHGRALLRTLPGNWRRFLRTWRGRKGAWGDLFAATWLGAVAGRPVGG